VQCVTLLVGQIVTVIVDDQLQLGALRQLGRFVEVQSPVLHTRAQRGHVITVRPPTVGWQADCENGYGSAPSNTAAYANKSLQELCRNCVRPTRKPRRTGTNTASHRRVTRWPQPVDRLRVAVRRYRLVKVAGINFQACSFNHSDISPHLESTSCERSDRDYRTRRRFRFAFLHRVSFQRFTRRGAGIAGESCQTCQPRAITYGGSLGLRRGCRARRAPRNRFRTRVSRVLWQRGGCCRHPSLRRDKETAGPRHHDGSRPMGRRQEAQGRGEVTCR